MKKRIDSFRFAFTGIAESFRQQTNMQIHTVAAIVAIGLSFWLEINAVEWTCIIFSCALVICLELMNTAIERICDFIEPKRNEKIRIIKDISAAAVLVASIAALITGGIIFIPKFF